MDLAAGTGDTRISRAPAGEVAALPRGLRRWQVRGSHGAAGGGGHGARGAAPSAARPRLSTAARRGKLGASRSRAVTTLREASTVRLAPPPEQYPSSPANTIKTFLSFRTTRLCETGFSPRASVQPLPEQPRGLLATPGGKDTAEQRKFKASCLFFSF